MQPGEMQFGEMQLSPNKDRTWFVVYLSNKIINTGFILFIYKFLKRHIFHNLTFSNTTLHINE
ncbi:hypothetical protein H8356DRAFT_1333076 [Neocallimastix lanati (nom. inval.)]|nr:hypothetical protein H8356DRAFT_1333076 [Neocallimastix sp. JGI-2020a]